jgi:hypothetical protein
LIAEGTPILILMWSVALHHFKALFIDDCGW